MADVTPSRYAISVLSTFPMEVNAGRVTVPVKVGDAIGAKLTATNAVVAILVLFSPAVAVVARGDQVNSGLAIGAKLAIAADVTYVFVSSEKEFAPPFTKNPDVPASPAIDVRSPSNGW